jgi:hypothetical protein
MYGDNEGDISLWSIWGSSASDVYVVGSATPEPGRYDSYVLHFDGVQWTTVPVPAYGATGFDFVWGASASDVYLEGGNNTETVLLHYDGSQWIQFGIDGILGFGGLWGASGDDVFASGYTVEGGDYPGALIHLNGTSGVRLETALGLRELGGVWGFRR